MIFMQRVPDLQLRRTFVLLSSKWKPVNKTRMICNEYSHVRDAADDDDDDVFVWKRNGHKATTIPKPYGGSSVLWKNKITMHMHVSDMDEKTLWIVSKKDRHVATAGNHEEAHTTKQKVKLELKSTGFFYPLVFIFSRTKDERLSIDWHILH